MSEAQPASSELERQSCVSAPILPTMLTTKQRYEQSDKGRERSRRRDAQRRAQRLLDKNAKNQHRFIDRFGSYCGKPTASAGRTTGTLDTSLTPVTVAEITPFDKSLKKFRRSMMRVNLLRPQPLCSDPVVSRWNDQPVELPKPILHPTVTSFQTLLEVLAYPEKIDIVAVAVTARTQSRRGPVVVPPTGRETFSAPLVSLRKEKGKDRR